MVGQQKSHKVCDGGTDCDGIWYFPPLVVIFEGQPKGCIAWTFSTFNDGAKYCCQKRAWMDEDVMHYWIKHVLSPYLKDTPDSIILLLLLDEYSVH